MKVSFEYATQLQYENKALRERIRLLESGAAMLRLRKEYERLLEEKDREIRQLKAKLEEAIRQSVRNRPDAPWNCRRYSDYTASVRYCPH